MLIKVTKLYSKYMYLGSGKVGPIVNNVQEKSVQCMYLLFEVNINLFQNSFVLKCFLNSYMIKYKTKDFIISEICNLFEMKQIYCQICLSGFDFRNKSEKQKCVK